MSSHATTTQPKRRAHLMKGAAAGGDLVLVTIHGGYFGLDRGEARALALDMLDVLGAPSEAMFDAARGLFLYFAMAPHSSMTLGEHLAAGAYPTAGLTPEQLAHRGAFPKEERAAMVWAVMVAAARDGG